MKSVSKTRRRVKLSDEGMRRRRYGDLRRLFRDRYGPTFPDHDDAAREDLRELLLPISLSPHADLKMRNAIEVWAPWVSEDEAQELVDDIKLSPRWERMPTAKKLGERLNLTYAQRAKLDIRTIRACDISEAGMALIRKQKKRQRDRLRRKLRGAKPRAEYLAASISQTKPWIAAGFNTRRTWERDGKPSVASPRQIKLSTTEHEPATAGECEVAYSSLASSLCVRLSTATTAWPAGTSDIWAEEAAWQSTWDNLEAAA